MMVLKAAANSSPKDLAKAIAAHLREGHQLQVMAMGAAAVNQTMKATATARGHLAHEELDLIAQPAFEVSLDGKTQMLFTLTLIRRL